MLRSVELVNFRCFRQAQVRLGPLTVLVGPNASGKTSLLRAIAGYNVASERDVWHHDAALPASLVWKTDTKAFGRVFSPAAKKSGTRFSQGQYVHFDPEKIRAQQQVSEQPRLSIDGANLVNVMRTMPRRQEERLAQDLARLVPVISDVSARPSAAGSHRLVFQDRWDEDLWYEPTEVSDGTLLVLALLALRYQMKPVEVVAIEEPEHGLHPYLLGELIAMLRKLANGELGAPLQMVMATQSAELLEFVEPSEVRFLSRRQEDGSVVIDEAPTDSETWREAYTAHQESLGNLWLSGSLGGVPTG